MKASKSKSIPRSQLAEIRRLHGEIIGAARMSLKKAIRVGELLSRFRHKANHGEWLPWVEKHLSFTPRTAQNYIRVYENRAQIKNETVSHLGTAYRLLADTGSAKKPAKPKESGAKDEVGESIPDSTSSHGDGGADVTTDVSSQVAPSTSESISDDARDLKQATGLGTAKSDIIIHAYGSR